ncbi:glyoxalase/bleomycin resistance protein/dioxygenase [Gonapodya prolifera JEL478]|uniref:Glyoxalase/bleomycin resistance protein/dioxygenase n=1 Tax=Gonapodya prolifera (strain JEL478) TaxID=1344416 RepID=A0A139AKE7_GONPJ|nr:glyoxalase/bleomycin resistance protein/dioxygenase [Gonapodya prolifera JEL478]|eukprot:KXS17249.1 glyoxalase/bleomycin resistance protein/dioxygenase [Gonapodya prolifera JEL478]
MVVGYVCLGTNDLDKAKVFYDALLAPIGGKIVLNTGRGLMYSNGKDAGFLITTPFDKTLPANPGNGPMVAFQTPTRKIAKDMYEYAMSLGCKDEGPIGLRGEEGPEAFYAAYFRDPEGNKLCVYRDGGDDGSIPK